MPPCKKITSKNLMDRSFTPQYTTKYITEKFYARHDRVTIDPKHLERVQYYEREIEKRREPHNTKMGAPRSENQTYGWLADSVVPYDKTDDSIQNHHRTPDPILKNVIDVVFEIRRFPFLYRQVGHKIEAKTSARK